MLVIFYVELQILYKDKTNTSSTGTVIFKLDITQLVQYQISTVHDSTLHVYSRLNRIKAGRKPRHRTSLYTHYPCIWCAEIVEWKLPIYSLMKGSVVNSYE